MGSAHKSTVNTFKTTVLDNGRPSLLQPCTSFLHIKEKIHYGATASDGMSEIGKAAEEMLGQTVFNHTERDNKLASSIEDNIFLKLMDKEVYRDESIVGLPHSHLGNQGNACPTTENKQSNALHHSSAV